MRKFPVGLTSRSRYIPRVYEDLEKLAQLKFIKQMEAIAAQTRGNVVDAKRRFAATAAPGIRSGPHDAELARLYIEGAEEMVRTLFQIWVDLIKQRNGYIARVDIPFIAGKVEGSAHTKKGHLKRAVSQQRGLGTPSLIAQADMRMSAAASNARRDLELIVREHEAFPNKEKQSMRSPFGGQDFIQGVPKRFSAGRRVLFGVANRVGTVQSVAGEPGQMGEFVHQLLVEKTQDILPVLGCDMRPFPDVDEDLARNRPNINIQNVGNLNLGVQIGTITSALQNISQGDESQQRFALAIEE